MGSRLSVWSVGVFLEWGPAGDQEPVRRRLSAAGQHAKVLRTDGGPRAPTGHSGCRPPPPSSSNAVRGCAVYKRSNHRGEEAVQLLLGALGPSQLAHWLHGGLSIAARHRVRALVPDNVYELRGAICGRSPLSRSAGWLWWCIYKSGVPSSPCFPRPGRAPGGQAGCTCGTWCTGSAAACARRPAARRPTR